MRNIVGQPVSGTDFFQRESIVNLIYRRLDAGSNIFMAAPRRVGKTSIMYYLRDNPREGYAFIYLPTEAIDSSELFFKRLFDALLNSEAVSEKVKLSEKSKSILDMITGKVKKIGAFGVELELHDAKNELYSDVFLELMSKLDREGIHIVIMIDEFPSTVENINQKYGLVEAVRFLKLNRTIRQKSAGGIQFIYTGSIGLPAIVNKLSTPESINDLNQVEVPPLSLEEGKLFAKRLLQAANVPFQTGAIEYLLKKISWMMPFFIQLSIQELVDIFDSSQKKITSKIVEIAFDKICNRRNNIHFDSYYNRLNDAFLSEDYDSALKILNLIAEKREIQRNELFSCLEKDIARQRLDSIIESLEYDGYINLRDENYSFNSPILRLWWNKYIRN